MSGLEKPIQITNQGPHFLETILQPAKDDESTNRRKRKKTSESDDAGKSKQIKVDKNGNKNADDREPLDDNGHVSKSPNRSSATTDVADAADKPTITTAAPTTTATATTASSHASSITATTSSEESQVSIITQNMLVIVKL